jgi:hypothetical protein
MLIDSQQSAGLDIQRILRRGQRAVVLPGLALFGLFTVIGVAIVVIGRFKLGSSILPQEGLALAVILACCVGLGSALGWIWSAFAVRRWWDWALAADIDPTQLFESAVNGNLMSRSDSWWCNRESTRIANHRHAGDQ